MITFTSDKVRALGFTPAAGVDLLLQSESRRMPYVVYESASAPHFIRSELVDWDKKVPSLSRRVEISRIFRDGTGLFSVDDLPDYIKLKAMCRKLPDIFRSQDGIHIINQHMKEAIDELDPGIHQIMPIPFLKTGGDDGSKGVPVDGGSYYILNVHVKQDSIVDEMSSVERNAFDPENTNIMKIKFPYKGLNVTIRNSALNDYNLWREKRYPGSYLMSDAMFQLLKQRKLKFFDPRKAKII